jgi:hypothetical protein
LATQLGCQVKHAKGVQLRSAEDRVGRYLMMELLDAARRGTTAHLPLEKRLTGSQLCMTRETFSCTLGAVAWHGLRVDGDRVIAEDAEDIAAVHARLKLDPVIDGCETIRSIVPETPRP